MNDPIPHHNHNPKTFSTIKLQMFDVEMIPLPPGTMARPRPANRPRKFSEGSDKVTLQIFEVEAIPLPPGTKATPRPTGLERPTPEELDAQPEQIQIDPNYMALIQKNKGWWIGWIEQIAGVNAQEKTREQLLESLQVALREALKME
jgi:hypothetical protein